MQRRFFLQCSAIGALASSSLAHPRYIIRDAANPEFRPSQLFFGFEDITSPPFEELRRRFAFAEADRKSVV